jgi:hypothetical protein
MTGITGGYYGRCLEQNLVRRPFFLDIFNIDHSTFQYAPQALTLQTLAAIAVPLIAALMPVFRGALIPCAKPLPAMELAAILAATRLTG